MVVTRSQSIINEKKLAQKKILNNNLNDVIQEDNHDDVNDKDYLPEEEYYDEDYDEDYYEDYYEDYEEEEIVNHEEYLKEKEKVCKVINKLINDVLTLNKQKKIRLQSEQDDEPEYINVMFELFDNIIEKDKYLMYKGEEQFNKLYQVVQDKLYEFIISIFINYKRPDLSYKLYYNYKDYFNLDFDKCFINIYQNQNENQNQDENQDNNNSK